jgi:hypothetical protein
LDLLGRASGLGKTAAGALAQPMSSAFRRQTGGFNRRVHKVGKSGKRESFAMSCIQPCLVFSIVKLFRGVTMRRDNEFCASLLLDDSDLIAINIGPCHTKDICPPLAGE